MALLALLVLLRLVSKYCYLLSLTILDSLCCYCCAVNIRSAYNNAIFLTNSYYLVKNNFAVSLNVKLLDEESISCFNLVLLAACNDDCVHSN